MPQIAARLDSFTESVIREMTRIADAHGAINLAQGFPDFDPPEELVAAAKEALSGEYHQYSVTWGAPSFRQALAKKQSRFMGLDLDPDANIVVTCGSTEAMMAAMMTACNPGDKVVIFPPFTRTTRPTRFFQEQSQFMCTCGRLTSPLTLMN